MTHTQRILQGQLKRTVGLHKQIEKARKSVMELAGKISAEWAAYTLALLDRAEFALYYVEGDDVNAYDLVSAMGRANAFIDKATETFEYSLRLARS